MLATGEFAHVGDQRHDRAGKGLGDEIAEKADRQQDKQGDDDEIPPDRINRCQRLALGLGGCHGPPQVTEGEGNGSNQARCITIAELADAGLPAQCRRDHRSPEACLQDVGGARRGEAGVRAHQAVLADDDGITRGAEAMGCVHHGIDAVHRHLEGEDADRLAGLVGDRC
ncbi:MAG: hypothetical protein FD152_3308 [Xanthobacteraceae bacterium]|nr:MAG: hypothetical protein FD152_3308 [Xanthobacteraceae bacterium]